jgi:hypothetical protein
MTTTPDNALDALNVKIWRIEAYFAAAFGHVEARVAFGFREKMELAWKRGSSREDWCIMVLYPERPNDNRALVSCTADTRCLAVARRPQRSTLRCARFSR